MKLKTHHKTVMFYGNVLQIPDNANWIAAFPTGRIAAFMEKPDCNSQDNKWDNRGTTWSPDVHVEMEGMDWQDTLTYCPDDQLWMLEAVVRLEQARSLNAIGLLSSEATDYVLNILTDALRYKAEGFGSLHATWDSWLKHAVPNHLRDNDLTNQLRERLFPSTEEAEYRVIKNYYGRVLIVPPQARWIAMDINGKTYVYETEPVIRVGCWRENINGEDNDVPVAWYPPAIAAQHWQDSLMEIQL
mgnify:FL=1